MTPDPGRAGRRWGLCHHSLRFRSSWLTSLPDQLADVLALGAPDQGCGLVTRPQRRGPALPCAHEQRAQGPGQAAEPAVGGRRGGRGAGREVAGAGGPPAAAVAAQSALASRKLAAVVPPTHREARGPRPQHSITTAFKHTVKLSGSHVGHVDTRHPDSAISTFLKEKIARK